MIMYHGERRHTQLPSDGAGRDIEVGTVQVCS
jgi:hypothetical protein